MNFGVLEVATSNSKATAPGWAYVAVGPVTASHPSSRKRVRNELPSSQRETTAKQDAKILRELAALDRENHRDVNIPVPVHHRDNAGRGMCCFIDEVYWLTG
jgi:zinc finger HIT domain-containing protein 1